MAGSNQVQTTDESSNLLAPVKGNDLLDSAFDDILEGRDASQKLARVARGEKVVPLRSGPFRQNARRVERSAIDDAVQELIEETGIGGKGSTKRMPADQRDAASQAARADAALDAALGATAAPRARQSGRAAARPDHLEAAVVASAEQRALAAATSHYAARQAGEAVSAFLSFVDSVSREFPDVRSDVDLIWLMDNDPFAATRFQGRQAIGQRLAARADQALHEAGQVRQVAFNLAAEHEDAQFHVIVPGWGEHEALLVSQMLASYGVSNAELTQFYTTPVPLGLADPRAFRVLVNAASQLAGQQLSRENELWLGLIDLFEYVGYTSDEIRAIANGGPVLLRDHRMQWIVKLGLDWHLSQGMNG